MIVSLQDDSLKLLMQVGFTEAQAKIYLTLCSMGQTDAKSLAKQANIPRQAAYRTLGELQEKGIIEKIIAIPQEYRAIPLHDGLSIMIGNKAKEYAKIAEKAKEFLGRYEEQTLLKQTEEEYSISIIEGKEAIIKKIRTLTGACKSEVWVCQTLQRWIQVNVCLSDTIEAALRRGVNYRVIIDLPEGELAFPKDLKPILKHPNYQVKVANRLRVNATLHDEKYGCFSFYPSKSLSESPVIVTNHPSLLIGFRDYFKNQWRDSKKLS
jgi:sugar-specific transcriptional regulator TrmB